ncbi:MAG: type II toxin-antitoxin system CcdA family antitoxin [Candidatus Njordarchaeia archaeon]
MSDVISVRVPKELKDKARKYNINISRIVRESLEKEIKKRETMEIAKRLVEKIDLLRSLAKIAPELQRETREED